MPSGSFLESALSLGAQASTVLYFGPTSSSLNIQDDERVSKQRTLTSTALTEKSALSCPGSIYGHPNILGNLIYWALDEDFETLITNTSSEVAKKINCRCRLLPVKRLPLPTKIREKHRALHRLEVGQPGAEWLIFKEQCRREQKSMVAAKEAARNKKEVGLTTTTTTTTSSGLTNNAAWCGEPHLWPNR